MCLCVYISAVHLPRRTWLATEDTQVGLQSKLVDCCIMKPSATASKQSRQAPELQELLERGRKRRRVSARSSRQEAPLEDVEMKEDGCGQPSMVVPADDKEQEWQMDAALKPDYATTMTRRARNLCWITQHYDVKQKPPAWIQGMPWRKGESSALDDTKEATVLDEEETPEKGTGCTLAWSTLANQGGIRSRPHDCHQVLLRCKKTR